MVLESNIFVRRTPEEVWSFLGNISNLPKWDRGVAAANETSSSPTGAGYSFDTVSHSASSDQGRMSYRIAEAAPDGECKIQLTSSSGNARFFKTAEWRFRVKPEPAGARVICSVDFALRLRYLFMAPVLYIMRSAIHKDLRSLKMALEGN